VEDSLSAGTLDFSVHAGPASIGASVGTAPTGRNYGSRSGAGSQGDMYVSPCIGCNTVNANWHEEHPFYVPEKTRGSTDYQGVEANNLLEMGSVTTPSITYVPAAVVAIRCTAGFGDNACIAL